MAGLLAQIVGYFKQIADKYQATVKKSEQLYGNKITEIRDKVASAVSTLDQKANSRGATLTGLLGLDQKLAPKTSEPEAPAIPEVPQAPKTAPASSKPAAPEAPKTAPLKPAAPEAPQAPKAQTAPSKPAAPAAPQAPKAQPAVPQPAAPTEKLDDSELELTPEEMERILKRFDELEKTIKALERRVSELEHASSGNTPNASTGKSKLSFNVTPKNYPTEYYYYGCVLGNRPSIEFVDGRRGYLRPISTSEWNYTVGQTRKVADMFGYAYDKKTDREALGWELVSRYGNGEWAVVGKKAVDANGVTYDVIETSTLYDPEALAFASNQKEIVSEKFTDRYNGDPFVVDPSWSEEEIRDNLVRFINNLVRK